MLTNKTHLGFRQYMQTIPHGPLEEDYLKVTEWMFQLNKEETSREYVQQLFPYSLWGSDYRGVKSLFNRIYNAGRVVGTYDIMQDLYSGYVDPGLSLCDYQWDTYIQSQISSIAVRHRVKELREVLKVHEPESLLDVACGSGIGADTCLNYGDGLAYVGIDADTNAIKYCEDNYKYSVLRFYPRDIRDLDPDIFGTFDMVWCSGLFDYFSTDRVFMSAAKRLLKMSNHAVVIGNMGPANMTVPMMNLLGWKLFYRTKAHLRHLAQTMLEKYSNFKTYEITSDPTGIQHYLYLYK